MKNNNKGYSLTELLLTMFIFSIVMLGIAGIMRSSSVFYRNGLQEVEVQEEAQMAVSLIEESLVDAKGSIEWQEPQKRLVFRNADDELVRITFMEDTNTLLYAYTSPDATTVYDPQPMAQYVTDFEVTGISSEASNSNCDNKVTVSVTMDNDGYAYTATKEVFLRNRVENPSISLNSEAVSGDDDEESEWSKEIVLDRYDTYNLSSWEAIKITKCEAEGSFNTYFSMDSNYNVTVNPSYLQNLSAQSDDSCGVKINDAIKIKFTLKPVKVSLSENADIFVHYAAGTNVNGQGYQTYIEVEGIDVNKALQANGISATAEITLNDGSSSKTCTQNLAATTNCDVSGAGQLLNQIELGVSPDVQSSGMIIGARNGAQVGSYTGGQSGTLDVTITLSPKTGTTPYSKTLNYKFRIAGNVL